jgi:hypothetical protein
MVIAGLAASVIIVALKEWGSVVRTKVSCDSDEEIARICVGKKTTVDLRVRRDSHHRVTADLGDAKAIEQTGRATARLTAPKQD